MGRVRSVTLDLVLLAGGRGRRLGGVVKPLLEDASGTTLLEKAAAVVDHGTSWIVAPAELHPRLARAAARLAPKPRWVTDPGEGPGWAALAAARASDAGHLFLCATDHPHPSPTLAARLVGLVSEGSGAWVVGEPSFSVVDRRALLAAGETDPPRSLTRMLARCRMSEVPIGALQPEERAGLADADTPEDVARFDLRDPRDETPGPEGRRRS